MEYKYFTPNKSTTPEGLKKQYKKLVLKYHVDRLGSKEVSKEEYLLREKTMSEINIEYARLRKRFSSHSPSDQETLAKSLKKVQTELARILKEIPEETKNEIRHKTNKFLLTQWQQKIGPLLPGSLQQIANTIINEKVTGFDLERELNKLDVEKLLFSMIFRKK